MVSEQKSSQFLVKRATFLSSIQRTPPSRVRSDEKKRCMYAEPIEVAWAGVDLFWPKWERLGFYKNENVGTMNTFQAGGLNIPFTGLLNAGNTYANCCCVGASAG
jgi:hypothetical protein